MKKPVVDYRQFRLSKLNDPQFSHLKLLLGWLGYFLMYLLTENLIPEENCHVIHCALDDIIPFCEYFVIFYVGWYLLVAGSLLYFALYNVESFRKLQIYIMLTQAIAALFYIFYPSVQNLRPAEFERDNLCTKIIGLLYSFDTPTGVFPSLHVAYSLGIASVWTKEKSVRPIWKILVVVDVIMVCLSILFIKQHSVLDAVAAVIMCIFIEAVLYGKYWRSRLFSRSKSTP